MQSGLFALLGELQAGELQAVGGHLGMREAQFARQAQRIQESRVDGGFAAGELHDAGSHRLLVAQRLKHAAHRGEIGFVDVPRGIRVGEANRAGQVAAVGQIHIGEPGVAGVHVAQAAIGGTLLGIAYNRVHRAAIVAEAPLLHLQVQPGVGRYDVAKLAMLRAPLFHDHLAAVFEDRGIDQFAALGAERLRGLRQARLERLNVRTRICSFGL